MTVIEVANGSAEFEAVLLLWRGESDTLGPMPRGAFEDAARERRLLAVRRDDAVLGYVLFRYSRSRQDASITHLCVARGARGQGIADRLFAAVVERCHDCYDIRLKCRRDFEAASHLWQRLGFTAVGEEPGRDPANTLTTWRFPLAEPPLLRRLDEQTTEDRLRAVIDANVFLDLDDQVPGSEESRALVADWLSDVVVLQVTAELFNEIHRRGEPSDRERQRRRASTFPLVPRNHEVEAALEASIATVLPTATPNQRSDVRQLAMTAAGDIPVFVTRDTDFLAVADRLHELTQVRIVRPFEIVVHFDALRRGDAYRPERLFLGSGVRSALASASDLEPLAALMHQGQPSLERLAATRARLREMLALPDRFEVRVIRHGEALLAAYAVERADGVLHVPFFGVQHSDLGRTAARHWGEALVALAVREGRRMVSVAHAGQRVDEALEKLGFAVTDDGWTKICLAATGPPAALAAQLTEMASAMPEAAELARQLADAVGDSSSAPSERVAEVERALWPAKLVGTDLPSFIVPIQPRWAKDLFDLELAHGMLLGAMASTALNCENVFYRAALPAVLPPGPARVLWYVSKAKAYPGSMAVRACSQIEEVVTGPASTLFRRFKRLGVYQEADIKLLAGGDWSQVIMAFRFSKSELFSRAIPWEELQCMLEAANGCRNPLVSPLRITDQAFFDLYRRGVGHGP
jgi:GNAT superfamily N-acetyltransferase/predicted nucleic acid-binding protein